jgi:hypothetical protein
MSSSSLSTTSSFVASSSSTIQIQSDSHNNNNPADFGEVSHLSNTSMSNTSIISPIDSSLASLSKDEILRLYSKLSAEIVIKNKIIYDMKVKENWAIANEIMKGKSTSPIGRSLMEKSAVEMNKENIGPDDGNAVGVMNSKEVVQMLQELQNELNQTKTSVNQV